MNAAMAAAPVRHEELHGVARLIEERFGLMVGEHHDALAVSVRAVATRHSLPVARLLEQLAWNPVLLREVAGHLGVPETYFFRHPEVFDELAAFLERRLLTQDRVTVWSAGCCRGEELYSLAIVLDERLGAGWQARVSLAGCDVSTEALATAQAGVYGEWSFRGATSEARRHAAFERVGPGRWRVRADIRAALRFEHLSVQELVSQVSPGSVDAFLFRNVAVYFAPQVVAPLFEALAAALSEGGLLCLAATDPQPAMSGLAPRPHVSAIYERSSTHRHRQPAATPAKRARLASPFARTPGARRVPEKVPRPAPVAAPSTPPEDARQLADAGRVPEALALLEKGAPGMDAASRHLLRGQILLGAGRVSEAREELRRTLYLNPEHLLGRYWLAQALVRAQEPRGALTHLRELERQLRDRDGMDTLEDAQSTVSELQGALARLKEQLT